MKIIKPSIDLETWCLEVTCPTCKSELGIEAKDIRNKWSQLGSYYYVCVLCNTRHYIMTSYLPPIVTADVDKNRADPIVYSDD